MSLTRIPLALAMAVILAACGGGDEPTPAQTLEGRWTGTLALTETVGTCGSPPTSRVESHDISVRERAVVVQAASGARYDGALIADNAFDAGIFAVAAFVESRVTISYRNVADGRADATIRSFDQAFDRNCTRLYAGTMVRSVTAP